LEKKLIELKNKDEKQIEIINIISDEIPNNVIKLNDMDLIKLLIQKMELLKQNNFKQFINEHVIYFFITSLSDGTNRIVCKIGYTCDIIEREKTLKNEYGCNFTLLGVKLAHSIKDETILLSYLRNIYPELVINIEIADKKKREIFAFRIDLYYSFIFYGNKIESKKLSENINQSINQNQNDNNNINNNNDNNKITKTNNEIIENNDLSYQEYFEECISKDDNLHIRQIDLTQNYNKWLNDTYGNINYDSSKTIEYFTKNLFKQNLTIIKINNKKCRSWKGWFIKNIC
jgi:hypothetical protein